MSDNLKSKYFICKCGCKNKMTSKIITCKCGKYKYVDNEDCVIAEDGRIYHLHTETDFHKLAGSKFDPNTVKLESGNVMILDSLDNKSTNKYHRTIHDINGKEMEGVIDVYSVIKAFDIKNPAQQHMVKKALCAGLRGKNDFKSDMEECHQAIDRAIGIEG